VIFKPTELSDLKVVELEPFVDERGSFTRTFDAGLFAEHGFDARVMQCNHSTNPRAGTLRGMHYQVAPHTECKIVRCVRGRIYDVALDLRRDSPSFLRWAAIELSERNMLCMLIPAGFAHGFQTLEDNSEILYQNTSAYVPGADLGVRWDDPAFTIRWPEPPAGRRILSPRDRAFPDYEP
jgi:dTDP-4-dehydrorhamnose 3,5-epimerase